MAKTRPLYYFRGHDTALAVCSHCLRDQDHAVSLRILGGSPMAEATTTARLSPGHPPARGRRRMLSSTTAAMMQAARTVPPRPQPNPNTTAPLPNPASTYFHHLGRLVLHSPCSKHGAIIPQDGRKHLCLIRQARATSRPLLIVHAANTGNPQQGGPHHLGLLYQALATRPR